MRIIAGEWKGRKLKSWTNQLPVRPMTDRVKETVFNVLNPYLFEGCKVLDLFSGTGSLALEALSR
ncbi:MAG: RsmD family RNA methyltransferase, partial [Oligoflexia bacterium]|nr:RsmD family RNA methyltransferase [Oligoflexia bacterium]